MPGQQRPGFNQMGPPAPFRPNMYENPIGVPMPNIMPPGAGGPGAPGMGFPVPPGASGGSSQFPDPKHPPGAPFSSHNPQ